MITELVDPKVCWCGAPKDEHQNFCSAACQLAFHRHEQMRQLDSEDQRNDC